MRPQKRSIFVFIILLIVLVVNAAIFFGNISIINNNEEQAHSTYQGAIELQKVELLRNDAEFNQRNYLRTSRNTYLQQYNETMSAITPQLKLLDQITQKDKELHSRFLTLQQFIQDDQALFESTITAFQQQAHPDENALINTEVAKEKNEDIHRMLNIMLELEQNHSTTLAKNYVHSIYTTLATFFSISVLNFLLIILGYLLLQREYQQRESLRLSEVRYRELMRADIVKIKETEEELKKSRDQLEVILQNVAEGITVQNAQGKLIYFNDAAAKLMGFSDSNEMRRDLKIQKLPKLIRKYKIYDESGKTLFPDEFPGRRVLDGVADHAETVIRYEEIRSKISRWSLVKARCILDDQGKLLYVINIVIDITESKESEKRKDEFISIASHELKTPITTIKAYVQLLQRHLALHRDQEALLYVYKVDAYLHKLTGLVGDLLDVSKMKAGKLQFNEEDITFDELVQNCISDIQPTTTTHQILLAGKTSAVVRGDRIRVEQVINNLLVNAIKYSPSADKVRVHLQRKGSEVVTSVKDYGMGIAKDKQHKIFEKFYRVLETSKGFSGLGIGLYLSAEIVERHGGRIWVESQKGHGSIFYFTLPVTSALKPSLPPE